VPTGDRLSLRTAANFKDLLAERSPVRAHVMRNTVHLVTAADFISFRPLSQPKIDRDLAGSFGRDLIGVDPAELAETARAPLSERPLTCGQLASALAPGRPARCAMFSSPR
jgi:hypothetical protein